MYGTVKELVNGGAVLNLKTLAGSRRSRGVVTRSMESCVTELQTQEKRRKDVHARYGAVMFLVLAMSPEGGLYEAFEEEIGAPSSETKFLLGLKVEGEDTLYPVSDRVVELLSDRVKEASETVKGGKVTINRGYLNVMLDDNKDSQDVALCAYNMNHWFNKKVESKHSKGTHQRVLLRLMDLSGEGDWAVISMHSDRYFPIPSVRMVLTSMALAVGKEKAPEGTALEGCRVFDYGITPYGLNLTFFNPHWAFDLKNPEAGVMKAEKVEKFEDQHGTQHKFWYPNGGKYETGQNRNDEDNGGTHLVFPCAKISNDESGGGSAKVELQLLEAVCDNTAALGITLKKTHSGAIVLEDDEYESNRTRERKISLITSEFADALAKVFDIEEFEKTCMKKLGLLEVEVENVKGALQFCATSIGMEGLLEDLLKSYEQFIPGKDTALDVERALTNAAQSQSEDTAAKLEKFAGDIILNGEKAFDKELIKA